MEYHGCSHEREVVQAKRTGDWNPDLTLHHEQCPICMEVAHVAGLMQELLILPDSTRGLLDPDLVWYRAQLMEMQLVEQRLLWPLLTAEIAASVVCTTTMGLWFAWNWPKLQQLLLSLVT